MEFQTTNSVLAYLYNLVPPKGGKFPGALGLKRAKYLHKILDNPQEKFKSIHIAGTSGKGSTTWILSKLLNSQGFKTGTTLSPHVIDISERFLVNCEQIPSNKRNKYLKQLKRGIIKASKSKLGTPSFFEATTALAFLIFAGEKVDYAVIETGLGGTFDATNTITRSDKLVIITKIGLDHTHILGNTLEEIACQKAGIIQAGNFTITSLQLDEVLDVIKDRVDEINGKLKILDIKAVVSKIITSPKSTSLDFNDDSQSYTDIKLSLLGTFQISNTALALSSISYLSTRDSFSIDKKNILKTLRNIRFIGRFDTVKYKDTKLIIDGAHNPQRMKAFISSLRKIFPNRKFHFLFSLKNNKDISNALKHIIPVSKMIISTNFINQKQGIGSNSYTYNDYSQVMETYKFINHKHISSPKEALQFLIDSKTNMIIVTGSLYLARDVYKIIG